MKIKNPVKNMKLRILQSAMLGAALTAATSASAAFSANGNLGDWQIWSPTPPPNGSYGGSLTVTTSDVGGPNGGGFSEIPAVYDGQDGGAYTFFGNGSSTPPPALSSQDFTQSIAIQLDPTVESGSMLIDETPGSTVKDPNTGTYELWAAENGFSLSGNGSAVTISAVNGGTIGTITGEGQAGWYQFNLTFSTTGETLSVYDLTTSSLLGSVNSSLVPGSDLSGSGYLWLTEQDFTFTDPGTLNVADLGATPVPEPTTMVAGAMLLLPFGASTLRMLRRKSAV
jgi:hypothetical protein